MMGTSGISLSVVQGGESVESSRGADYPGCRKRGFGQYGNYQDRDTPKTGSLCPRAFASRISIMNPELTYTLPAYQTACGIAT